MVSLSFVDVSALLNPGRGQSAATVAFRLFYSAAVCNEQEGSKGSTGSGKDDFRLGEALAYLANMRTFWMITVGVGECLLISFINTLNLKRCDLAAQFHAFHAQAAFFTAFARRLFHATPPPPPAQTGPPL